MRVDLIPCPWCSGEDLTSEKVVNPRKKSPHGQVYIQCNGCGATGPDGLFGDIFIGNPTEEQALDQAIYLWNARGAAFEAMRDASKAISDAVVRAVNEVHGHDQIDARRWRNARDCVRIGEHGEFVVIPGDTHLDDKTKREFDRVLE